MRFLMHGWNAEDWKNKFCKLHWQRDRETRRALLREVFASTVTIVLDGKYVSEHEHCVGLFPDSILDIGTKMYREELHFTEPDRNYATEFSVENEDCLVVAEKLVRQGMQNVAVLNMANRQNPGGGVYGGAGAQEESLFRRSNYFQSLYRYAPYAEQYGVIRSNQQYPLDRNFGGCFSPHVTVFRGPESMGYPLLDETWQVNFIAVAALNRPELCYDENGEARLAPELVPAAKNKIRTVFNIAIDQGMEVLVLGALGCGAFKNPPRQIAQLFAEILQEATYHGRFQKIIFAITGHNDNYRIFKEVFADFEKSYPNV